MLCCAPFRGGGFPPAFHLIEYCKPFFHTWKELFAKNTGKFEKFFARQEQKPADPRRQTPERAEKRQQQAAERQKIRRRAERDRRTEKQPQQSPARVERQRQQREKKREHEQRVRHHGQTGRAPPERTQQIVKHAQSRAERKCRRELKRLKAQRQLHQPNSRAKKPPAGAGSS